MPHDSRGTRRRSNAQLTGRSDSSRDSFRFNRSSTQHPIGLHHTGSPKTAGGHSRSGGSSPTSPTGAHQQQYSSKHHTIAGDNPDDNIRQHKVVHIKLSHVRMMKRAVNVIIFLRRAQQLCAMTKATRLTKFETDHIRKMFRAFVSQFGPVTSSKAGSFFRFVGVPATDAMCRELAATYVTRKSGSCGGGGGGNSPAPDSPIKDDAPPMSFGHDASSDRRNHIEQQRRQQIEQSLEEKRLATLPLTITQCLKVAQKLKRHHAETAVSEEELAFEALRENSKTAAAAAASAQSRATTTTAPPSPSPVSSSSALSPPPKSTPPRVMETDVHDCLSSFGVSAEAVEEPYLHQQQALRDRMLHSAGDSPHHHRHDDQQQRSSNAAALASAASVLGSPSSMLAFARFREVFFGATGPKTITSELNEQNDQSGTFDPSSADTHSGGGSATDVIESLLRPATDKKKKAAKQEVVETDRERMERMINEIQFKMDLPPSLELEAAAIEPCREMRGWRQSKELNKMNAPKNRFDAESEVGRGTGIRVRPTALGTKMIAEAALFRSQVTKMSDDALMRAVEKNIKQQAQLSGADQPDSSRSDDGAAGGVAVASSASRLSLYRRTKEEEQAQKEMLAARKAARATRQQQQQQGYAAGGGFQVRRFGSNADELTMDNENHNDDGPENIPVWMRARRRRWVPFMQRPIPRSEVSKQLAENIPSKGPSELCHPPSFLLSLDQRSQLGAKLQQEQSVMSRQLHDHAAEMSPVHGDARMAASLLLNAIETRSTTTAMTPVPMTAHGTSAPQQPDWATSGGGVGPAAGTLPQRPASTPLMR